MRVRMKVDVSGVRDGKPWPGRGEALDVPDDEGAGLCAAGLAEPVAAKDEPEKAVEPEPETRAGDEKPGQDQSGKRGSGRARKQG